MRNRDSHHLRLLVAAAFLASVPVQGALAGTGIYRYVDAQGVAHFTDSPRDGRYQRVAFRKPRITTPGAAKAWQLRGRRLAPHPTTSGAQWDRVIGANAREQRIQPALVKALIKAESNFDPTAVSKQGAQGLMQLMPGTARELGVVCAFDPRQNILGGTRYLRRLYDHGVRNFEMEMTVVAALCAKNGIACGMLCVAYLDRLKEDTVAKKHSLKEVKQWMQNAIDVLVQYIYQFVLEK